MGSSRFKGKTLSNLHGKPMLYRLIERIKHSSYIKRIILATTDKDEDNMLESFCNQNNLYCYRGSSDDVLLRLKNAATKYNSSHILEILGDNPIIHSLIIDACVKKYFKLNCAYLATATNEYPFLRNNKRIKLFPIGIRAQVFSLDTLLQCDKIAKEKKYREHATMYIADNPKLFNCSFLEAKGQFMKLNRPELTFAVNHKENLELINFIYSKNFSNNNNFSIKEAIDTYDNNLNLKKLMFPLYEK